MSNKSFLKMTKRSVRGSLSRFIAIVGIAALGSGFLAGLLATSPDMKESSNKYFNEMNMYDIYIQSNYGFSENDVEEIKKEPYVANVMAIEQYDKIMEDEEGERLETRVFYVDTEDKDRMNKIEILDGRYPKTPEECVIEIPNQYSYSAKIGDIFTDDDGKEYTVCGIARSPMFISSNGEKTGIGKGTIALAMYVQADKNTDIYTCIYIDAITESENTFSEEYSSEIDNIKEKVEIFSQNQEIARFKEIKEEALKELDENTTLFEKEKKDALNKISENENEIISNENKINEGYAEINSNLQKAQSGVSEISDGMKKIKDAVNEIEIGIDGLETSLNELKTSSSQLDSSIEYMEVNLENLYYALEDASDEEKQQIQEQIATCEMQLQQMNYQKNQINNSQIQINQNIKKLTEEKNSLNNQYKILEEQKNNTENSIDKLLIARKNLDESSLELADGKAEFYGEKEKALDELEKAEKNLSEARENIEDLENCEFMIFSRLDSTGVSGYKSDIDKVAAIASIFPFFFFLVSALVVLTTMTRMIEEERTQVGTLKALGYDNRIIRKYYVSYGVFATLLGASVGLVIGFRLFPKVISNAYSMMYNVPETETPFIWELAVIITLATLICITLTILVTCRNELKEKPAMLLQPKAPVAGKRILLEKITPLWSRIKFTHKVTLRNLFRYKKRFFMTVIGVAGCFALLLTGFGIRDSIGDIVQKQFGEISTYDISISVQRDKWQPEYNIYENEGFVAVSEYTIQSENGEADVTVNVAESSDVYDSFIHLRDRRTHEVVTVENDGIYLSEKLSEELAIQVGDIVEINNGKHIKGVKVKGFYENYVGNTGYMTEKTYKDIFNKEPDFNTLYVKIDKNEIGNNTMDDIVRKVMDEDGVNYAISTESIMNTFNDSVKNIDYIVGVIILSAGALSVIVLYNLTNINICERKKELATIKVLGFYNKEVQSYIFREIYLLSLIGSIVGIPFGILLHRFVIKTAEVGGMMFGRDIYPDSFIFSAVITIGFTVAVNLIMSRSIRKIDMVESMKANE